MQLNAFLPEFGARNGRRRWARGFVLPSVLIILVLMTIVVLFMMRRGTIDERLAANARSAATIDASAQFALRLCELWVAGAQPGSGATNPEPPPSLTAPVRADDGTTRPAWVLGANWTASAATLPVDLMPGIDAARCLVEDAREELVFLDLPSGNSLPIDEREVWRKYRISAEVRAGTRFARAQSEVRTKDIPRQAPAGGP